ncbi:MAG: SH3 domain-containing protein [Clostridia bacterium]|nr:SH3 domain-containing protein [Clostridia bacterium]
MRKSLLWLLAAALILGTVCASGAAESAAVIDFACARHLKYYTIYYAFDNDAGQVYYFLSDDGFVDVGTFTGSLTGGITMTFISDGQETVSHMRRSGSDIVLVDKNGLSWSYDTCSAGEAESRINAIGYKFGSAKVVSRDATVTITVACNAREAASYEGAIILWLRIGETYKYIDENDGWYLIELTNGKQGFIPREKAVLND